MADRHCRPLHTAGGRGLRAQDWCRLSHVPVVCKSRIGFLEPGPRRCCIFLRSRYCRNQALVLRQHSTSYALVNNMYPANRWDSSLLSCSSLQVCKCFIISALCSGSSSTLLGSSSRPCTYLVLR